MVEDVLKDAFYGCMQMAFSGQQSEMSDAYVTTAILFCKFV